jgi:hypothetical protein
LTADVGQVALDQQDVLDLGCRAQEGDVALFGRLQVPYARLGIDVLRGDVLAADRLVVDPVQTRDGTERVHHRLELIERHLNDDLTVLLVAPIGGRGAEDEAAGDDCRLPSGAERLIDVLNRQL